MSRPTSRVLACLALAAASFSSAHAGVGEMSGAVPSFGRLSPVQRVQDAGDCWYDNGWDGPGYYPCGSEWNSGSGGFAPVAPIIVPAVPRRHRHAVVVAHPPAAKPIYPGAPAFGAVGGGNFHQFHGVGVSHFGAPVSPGFTGAAGFHPAGAIGTPHIGAPATPGFAGVGGFHPSGGVGAPHIGAAASPGFAGGGFHGVGADGAFQGGGAGFGQGGIGHR
jgi:hypothetical protein